MVTKFKQEVCPDSNYLTSQGHYGKRKFSQDNEVLLTLIIFLFQICNQT